MNERLKPKAHVFDLDDTLIDRGSATRISGLIIGRLHPHHLPNLSIAGIAQLNLNHDRAAVPICGLGERVSFEFHARRKVYPGVKHEFERIAADGVDLYGDTGRPHKGDWVDMTEETLYKAGIGEYFKRIFYTPDGVKTAISKADGIQRLINLYDEVEFDDDDPRTVRFIAQLFPNVQVNLVQYRSTDLLTKRHKLDELPNLRRVTVLGKR